MIFHRFLYICQRVFQNHTLTNSPGDALGIPDLDETITAAGHKQPLVLGAPKQIQGSTSQNGHLCRYHGSIFYGLFYIVYISVDLSFFLVIFIRTSYPYHHIHLKMGDRPEIMKPYLKQRRAWTDMEHTLVGYDFPLGRGCRKISVHNLPILHCPKSIGQLNHAPKIALWRKGISSYTINLPKD